MNVSANMDRFRINTTIFMIAQSQESRRRNLKPILNFVIQRGIPITTVDVCILCLIDSCGRVGSYMQCCDMSLPFPELYLSCSVESVYHITSLYFAKKTVVNPPIQEPVSQRQNNRRIVNNSVMSGAN